MLAIAPAPEVISEISRLCDAARFGAAYELARAHEPFERWQDCYALCVAARLVQHLGAPQRSRKLALRAYRIDPSSAEARYWVGNAWLAERGPLATLTWLGDYVPGDDDDPHGVASFHWLLVSAFTALRDFDTAETWLSRAEEVLPGYAYTPVVKMGWLSAQDRYEEALELGREAVRERPLHRASVQALADLLELHGRTEEAVSVLAEVAERLESGAVHFALAGGQLALGRHPEALASLVRTEKRFLLAEDEIGQRISALRSDAAYYAGDDEMAIREARRAGSPFFVEIHRRLTAASDGRRQILDVPFVRQHRLTCVPACLATLGRFWKVPVDHLEIAERICYAGTASHSERAWARQNGWVTRELTVSWESVRALIDRGIPFIVDTVHAISAHAQVVVGYDERRGTIHIRDPYVPVLIEALAKPFLERYAAHGPRGFCPVPRDRAQLLEGLALPDAELYEHIEELEAALDAHHRDRASESAAAIARLSPEHRLNLSARRALAAYDANAFELVRVAAEALARFPNEPTWLLHSFEALRETVSPVEWRQRLEELCTGPEVHPVFREMLAAQLIEDDRHIDRAARTLRVVAGQLRDRSAPVGHLARCHWSRREFEQAKELFRFAACLEPTDETWSHAYFRAAFSVGEFDDALGFLEWRAARYRRNAPGPAITLFNALEALDRTTEAFERLDRALAARPEDGELLRFAARARARYGELERAHAHLEGARGCSAKSAWLRTAASVAGLAGDHERAIRALEEVVEAEPLAVDAHEDLAHRLTKTFGAERARAHLRAVCAKLPSNAALLSLHARWLVGEDPRELVPVLRKLIELSPADAWARRELVLTLASLGKLAEARAEHAQALEVAPNEVSGQLVLARLCQIEGDPAGATEAFQRAVELDADASFAISRWVETGHGRAARLAILERVEARVASDGVTGDGCLAWFDAARGELEPEELLARLESLRQRREGLWDFWLFTVRQLREMWRLVEAVDTGRAAAERFPLIPGMWLELGRALGASHEPEGELAALERAVTLGQEFVPAILELAEARERSGADDHGLSVLERGLHQRPLDTDLLLARADLLWRLGRRDDALASAQRAIEADPSHAGAWDRLRDWNRSEDFDTAAAIRAHAERRPWDIQLWQRWVEATAVEDPEQALALLEQVLARDPSNVELHERRAVLATRLGHRALAVRACRPGPGEQPLVLRGREAWVLAEFGDVPGAITAMREVVADRPDYLWGWRQIADWAESVKDFATAIEAARALVRLEPTSAVPYGYLGEALAQAGRKSEALKALERAVEIDPTYTFGLHRYMDLLFEADKLGRARRVIERVGRYAPAWSVAYWRLRLAAAKQKWPAVEQHARALFANEEAPGTVIDSARGLLSSLDSYWASRILFGMICEPEMPARLGQIWAATLIDAASLPSNSWVAKLRKLDPARAEAALVTTIEHLGSRGRVLPVLSLVFGSFRFARGRDAVWGSVGYAFSSSGQRLLTIAWMWGYENRSAQPWMLLNLASSLRDLGLASLPSRVSRDALRLAPDNASAMHAALLAFDACTAGDFEQARLLADEVPEGQLNLHYGRVLDLVRAVLALERTEGAGERAERTREAIVALRGLHPTPVRSLLTLEALQWRRLARRIGRASRSFGGMAAGYWDSALALGGLGGLAYLGIETEGRALLYFAAGYLALVAWRIIARG